MLSHPAIFTWIKFVHFHTFHFIQMKTIEHSDQIKSNNLLKTPPLTGSNLHPPLFEMKMSAGRNDSVSSEKVLNIMENVSKWWYFHFHSWLKYQKWKRGNLWNWLGVRNEYRLCDAITTALKLKQLVFS